jgi:hypothetical protein
MAHPRLAAGNSVVEPADDLYSILGLGRTATAHEVR